MKKFYVVFFLILFSSSFISAQSVSLNKLSGTESCSAKKQKMGGSGLYSIDSELPHSFDVLNYAVNIDLYKCFLSPYPHAFSSAVDIKLKVDSTLNSIQLNALSASLAVDSVALAAVSFSHSNDMLTVNLNRTYNAGEVVDVKIYYRHKDVKDNSFYVRTGFVFTDCEPEGARGWLPCWDRPSDKATLNLIAKVPSTVKLGSNGRLADSTKIADTIYYNWISRDPIATYLMVISAKVNYNLDIVYWHKISNPNDSIPIRFYWNTGESTSSLANIETKIIPMMTYYSTLFGEHPFEKNGFSTLNSDFGWGGMENQTLTSLCPNCWEENLVSHEFAHQWFGDMITCGTWADIWLNEGFATYCEALWSEHTGGSSSYKSAINADASYYLSANPGWPIYNQSWTIVTPNTNTLFNTAITYDKGGCVLHLLRYVLGDSTFFKVIKSYATDTANFKFKNSLTADFAAKVSQASGQDMQWFFDEWVYQANHPIYQNTYYFFQPDANTWQTGLTVNQTNSYFFKMPIEVKITFKDASDTLIRVMNDKNNQFFAFNFTKQPTAIAFDPNNNIVLKKATLSLSSTVPVELVSFSATKQNNSVLLKWKTATEVNNKGFEVQKSIINSSSPKERGWENLGFVDGKGTSTNVNEYSFKDMVLQSINYVYRLKQMDYDGSFKYSDEISVGGALTPEKYLLSQNYPNPFNPSTVISYQVPLNSHVKLSVYDGLGKEVAVLVNQEMAAGRYEAKFNASGLSSGIYFYKLQAGAYSDIKKAMLLK